MGEKLEVIVSATDQASGVLGKIGNLGQGLAKIGLGAVATGAAAATAGLASLGGGLAMALNEAMGAQEITAQLGAVIKSTGGAAGVTADMALGLADSLSSMTKFEDDAILAGENMLLTFTNIGKDVFPQTTQTMLDMSQAMGQDLKSSAIQLGKALNDPTKGMTALTRVGVTFTSEQAEMIEKLQESGDMMGAQKIILNELAREFGGSAKAAGETFAGQMERLKNTFGNVAESIGTALLPTIQVFAGKILSFVQSDQFQGWVEKISDWLTNKLPPAIESFSSFLSGQLIPGFKNVVSAMMPVIEFGQKIGEAFRWIFEMMSYNGGLKTLLIQFEDGSSFLGGFIEKLGVGEEQAENLSRIIVGVAKWIRDPFIPSVKEIAIMIGENLAPAIASVSQWITSSLVPAISTAYNWFKVNMLPTIQAFVDMLKEHVIPVVMQVASFLIDVLGKAVKGLSLAWQNDFMGMRTIFEGFFTQLELIFKLWKNIFEGDWRAVGETLRAIAENMKNTLVTVFSNTFDSIKSLFANIDWGQLGANIIDGIISGIKNATKRLIEAVKEIGRISLEIIKGFLLMKSPSKVFADQVGKQMVAGMAVGMIDGMKNFAGMVKPSFTMLPNLMMNIIPGANTGTGMLVPAFAAAPIGGGGSRVTNIEVNVTPGVLMSFADECDLKLKLRPIIQDVVSRRY